jgi:hypothetical protein
VYVLAFRHTLTISFFRRKRRGIIPLEIKKYSAGILIIGLYMKKMKAISLKSSMSKLFQVLVIGLLLGIIGCTARDTSFPPSKNDDLIGKPIGSIPKDSFNSNYARPITYGKHYSLEMLETKDQMYVILLRTKSWLIEGSDMIVGIQDVSEYYRKDLVLNFFCRRKHIFDRLDRVLFGMTKQYGSEGCYQPEAAWVANLETEKIQSIPKKEVECCVFNQLQEE